MSLTQRRTFPNRFGALAPAAVAIAALLGSLLSAAPAAAITPAEASADPSTWAATPYSPLAWADVPARGNAAQLGFDSEAGGLPDKSGLGTGLTALQPSSGSATAPYYVPANLSVAGGALNITATKGINYLGVNSQDNAVGVGVDIAGKGLSLTTTITSPAAAASAAQAGLWFGANDKNFIKVALIASSTTGRQFQLSKESNDASASAPSADQVTVQGPSQSALGTQPITLDLVVDAAARRATASYRIGTGAPVVIGTLTGLAANLFDGSLMSPTTPAEVAVTSFAGLFATKRNMAEASALVYSFDNFALAEIDVTPPAAVTALTSAGAVSGIDLAWQAPADGNAVGYRVYRSATSPVATTGVPLSGAAPITGTSFRDSATFGGIDYHYAVVAVDGDGTTSASAATGPVRQAAPAGAPVTKVDFTTAAGTEAAGYAKDAGAAYTAGRGYGWTSAAGVPAGIEGSAAVRAAAGQAADPRLASVIRLQPGTTAPTDSAVWRLDVPNGTYTVVAAVGDSGAGVVDGYGSRHTIRAEGVPVISGFAGSSARQYDEAALEKVTVTDGTLTIDAVGGTGSTLAYLEVYRTSQPAADTAAPVPPTGLAAAASGNAITLSWTASGSADATGHRVYRGTSAPVNLSTAPLSGGSPVAAATFTDSTAVAGTRYYYAVTAVDAAGNESGPSASVAGTVAIAPDGSAPLAPTGLTASPGDSKVALKWTASASADTVGYRVFRGLEPQVSTTGAPGSGVAPASGTTPITGTAFTDSGVTNGTTYFYVVVAVDSEGNTSPKSNEVVAVPLPANPTNVKVDFTVTNGSPAAGYLADWGQAFGPRTGASQGGGAQSYGWLDADGNTLSLVGNGRDRNRAGVPATLDSILHMQYGDAQGVTGASGVPNEGVWELAVPDGLYSVTVAVGDAPGTGGVYDSAHAINLEGSIGIERFVGSGAAEYRTVTSRVGVWDGKLTVDARGGSNTKIAHIDVTSIDRLPHVDTVLPENRVDGHDVSGGVSATIKVPYAGVGVSPTSLPGNVYLYEVASGATVPTTVGTSGGNDVISLNPNSPLKPNTAYRFVVSSGVTDGYGVPFVPFASLFTTGSGEVVTSDEFVPLKNIAFEKIELPTGAGKYWASFAFGPDGKLYGTTVGQGIFRFDVNDDGTLGEPESLGYEGSAIIGLLFDETSTAGDLRAWITVTTANFSELGQWVSSVHHLSGPDLETDRTVFAELPRSRGDHLSNSMAYGPDGRIYFLQGSNQAAGDLDNAWGQRGEQLLTAATLVFDPRDAKVSAAARGAGPINVKTAAGGTYDPYAPGAPLKIYASGIRNAYDLVFHSNGHLYVPGNGTAGGANTPGVTANADGTFTRTAAPGIPGFSTVNGRDVTAQCARRGYSAGTVPPLGNIATQRDLLFDVVEGGYYGHPNPERCEWVLNAGNDPATPDAPGSTETKYPIGTPADPNYRGVAYDFQFNKSPNGALEYQSSAFGGQLKGRLIVSRFSNNNDLIFLQPDSGTGKILGAQTSVGITGVGNTTMAGVDGFNDPLEVVEDVTTGNLYVNQYDRSGGDQKLYLLRVPASQQAASVSTSVDELVFSTVRSTTSAAKPITITNSSSEPVRVATSLVGGQPGEFQVSGGNVSVPARSSITVNVAFSPGNVTRQRSTTLRLTAGTDTIDIGLYGLAMLGLEGSNEPALNDVLGTLGYNLDPGWTTLAGGVEATAKGDEVLEPLFVKSGTAAPTMTPLAQYAPREDLPYGWYTGNGTASEIRKLGSIDIDGHQSLLPAASPGTQPSFDPGEATFGFYYYSNAFKRFGFTEDRLNTVTPHRARIYPARNRSGTPLANSYIVGFEDASNGDYQDYLFLVTGVKPVTDTGSADGSVRVDFTTKAGGLTPGYLRDYGQAFSPRTGADQGSGLTFGWKDAMTENDVDLSIGGTANLGNGRDRGTTQPDQRLDSFMHMQGDDPANFNGTRVDAYWEMALPNGRYEVTVAVGDPTPQPDNEANQINVEQVPAITLFAPSGVAGSATRHQTVTATATVDDGFLTIDARGGTNTKLNYVDIVPLAGGGGDEGDDPTDGAQVKVNFQPATAPTPAGWTADSGAAFTEGSGSGWVSPLTGAPLDRTGVGRYRTAATSGIAYPSSPLLQTYAFLQAPTAALWEYTVPNGEYEVAVSVGDSAFLDSVHTVTAEDRPVVASFTPTAATPFQTGKRLVTVTDGKLTLAGTGSNTKINWVSIRGAGLDPALVPSVKINYQTPTAVTPSGFSADTGAAYAAVRGYGWLVDGQPADRSGATRNRPTATAGIAYPTGDVTRQTLIQAQTGAAGAPGVWEYAVANGVYDVAVSVGDAGFLDSVHAVEAEGTPVVAPFVPSGATPFQTGTAQVTVSDGRLTLTPTGTNTKLNWITITGEALVSPAVTVSANGERVDTAYTGGPATVTIDAVAPAGTSLSAVTWAINSAAPTPYSAPITIDALGTQTLVVTATSSAGEQTTRTLTFTIDDVGGTVRLRNEQATRTNGIAVPGFSEDWLVMQRINGGITTHKFIDRATVTVINDGPKNMRISNVAIGGPGSAQFALVDPAALPLTLAPGASTPVTVQFVADSGTRGIREAELRISSTDPSSPTTTVQLRGGYMTQPEGTSELTLSELTRLFGWTTNVGTPRNGDEMRTSALNGEEVRSLQWRRADSALPVTARQLAALHGCCDQTASIGIAGAFAAHAAPYGQSVLPLTAQNTPTQLSTNPTGTFPLTIAGQSTDKAEYMAVKTWPVRDRDGDVVAGSWIVGFDYVSAPNQCGVGVTNCDYQDNLYLVTNVVPVSSTDTTAPAAAGTATAVLDGSSVNVAWTGSAAPDLAGYLVERASSFEGPWAVVSGGTPSASLAYTDPTPPATTTAFYRVVAVDASGNRAQPSNVADVALPAPTAAALRINAGGPAVTTGSGTWLADAHFTGGKAYSNPKVTQIAGTTDDAVYLTERSASGSFSYDIPLASGQYSVKLHFAEIYWGATGSGAGGTGKRVFDVDLEGGAAEIAALDLNQKVAPMTAHVTATTLPVVDGSLDIDFTPLVNQPKLSAIEILRIGDAADPPAAPVAPAAPTAVLGAVSGAGVELSWTASTSTGVTGYRVERATTATGPWTTITPVPVAASGYTDSEPPASGTVYYRVLAVGGGGASSAPSAVVPVEMPPADDSTAIRLNAGGPAVTLGGTAWAADSGFAGGKAYSNAKVTEIAATTDDVLYRTERSSTSNLGSFAYDFTVPDGTYEVKLHFAEIYWGATGGGAGGAGKRVFDVNLEGGGTEIVGLDINARVGAMAAYVASEVVTVSDGTLDIDFSATVNQPKVSAIEIVPASATPPAPSTAPGPATGLTASVAGGSVGLAWTASPSSVAGYVVERSASASGPWTGVSGAGPIAAVRFTDSSVTSGSTYFYRVVAVGSTGLVSTPSATASATIPTSAVTPIRINTGGGAVTVDGVDWSADSSFAGGRSYSNSGVTQIGGTTSDALYLTERTGVKGTPSFDYNIPVVDGEYTVRLHFAEIYFGAAGGGAGGVGKRVFSVNLEGGPSEIDSLDLSAVAAPGHAYVVTRQVVVTDGTLDIDFLATVDLPKISAIEVIAGAGAAAVPSPPAAPTRVTAALAGSANSITWSASTSAPEDSAGYVVERRSTASGQWVRLNPVPTGATAFSDQSPPSGTLYYRVSTAGSGAVASAPTEAVPLTRP